MAHHTTRSLYGALTKLIDLPKNARKIIITMEVGKEPQVQVEYLPTIVGELVGEAVRYTLHKIDTPAA